MNTETIKNEWKETRGKIKARFGKLTDDSIDSLKGNLDQLSSKLQHVYSYAKEQADREVAGFKASLHEATEPVKAPLAEVKPTPVEADKKLHAVPPMTKKDSKKVA